MPTLSLSLLTRQTLVLLAATALTRTRPARAQSPRLGVPGDTVWASPRERHGTARADSLALARLLEALAVPEKRCPILIALPDGRRSDAMPHVKPDSTLQRPMRVLPPGCVNDFTK